MNRTTIGVNSRASWPSSWLRMLLLTCVLITLLPAVCMAQDSTSAPGASVTANARASDASMSTSNRPSSTRSAPAQTHTVQVGLADHKFNPDITEANIGDTVEFRFYPTNHSIVRAEFGFPCIPYEMTGNNKQGFFSGFNAVSTVLDDPPKYSIKINDTNPIFFYCSAPGSCITYGMVGAINPNANTSISTQQQKAKDSAYMLNPGEPFPAEAPLPSNLPSSTSVPAAAAASQKHTGLSAGAIAGIVIAALSVITLAAALFFFMGRSKTLKDEVTRKQSSIFTRHPSIDSSQMLQQSPTPLFPNNPLHSPEPHQTSYFPSPAPPLDAKFTSPTHTHTQHAYILPPPGHPAYSAPATHSIYSDTSPVLHELPHTAARSTSPRKLGAYGLQQEQGVGAAPPYGWLVNAAPAEVEGSPVRGAEGRRERARWQEVGGGEEGRML